MIERRRPSAADTFYLIDHVGPVGGGQHRDVPELLDAVHLCQELSQDPVAHAAGARGPAGADGKKGQDG